YTAGIIEMIIQSHKGYVELLPAIPSTWLKGSLTGIRVQGGFEVNIFWDRMQVNELEVTCNSDNLFVLKSQESIRVHDSGREEKRIDPVNGLIEIDMKKGKHYKILFKNKAKKLS